MHDLAVDAASCWKINGLRVEPGGLVISAGSELGGFLAALGPPESSTRLLPRAKRDGSNPTLRELAALPGGRI